MVLPLSRITDWLWNPFGCCEGCPERAMVSQSIGLYIEVLVAELRLPFQSWRQHNVLEAREQAKNNKCS